MRRIICPQQRLSCNGYATGKESSTMESLPNSDEIGYEAIGDEIGLCGAV
jgi:hypothetical protein